MTWFRFLCRWMRLCLFAGRWAAAKEAARRNHCYHQSAREAQHKVSCESNNYKRVTFKWLYNKDVSVCDVMCEVFTIESGNLKDFVQFNTGGSKKKNSDISWLFSLSFCESANSKAQWEQLVTWLRSYPVTCRFLSNSSPWLLLLVLVVLTGWLADWLCVCVCVYGTL